MKMRKFFMMAACLMTSALVATSLTSCEDDEEDILGDLTDIQEKVDFTNLKVVGNADGTITVSGSLTTNTKLKTFEFVPTNGGKKIDLLADVTENNRTEDDHSTWTCKIPEKKIPVDLYTLSVRCRMGTPKDVQIGSSLKFDAGAGSNSTKGSYLSLCKEKSYTLADLTADNTLIPNVEVILNSNNELAAATTAKNSTIKDKAGKAEISYSKDAKTKGVIRTSTGCIANVTVTYSQDGTEAQISGVMIKSNDLFTVETGVTK